MISPYFNLTGKTEQELTNVQTVLAFYDKVLDGGDFSEAQNFFGASYTQHNPLAEDGPEGLRKFLEIIRPLFPNVKHHIKRVFADNDHVVLHLHVVRQANDPGLAVTDIFRLAGGRIVEHWDVIQDVPHESLNANSMF